jgi:hypothetical protein
LPRLSSLPEKGAFVLCWNLFLKVTSTYVEVNISVLSPTPLSFPRHQIEKELREGEIDYKPKDLLAGTHSLNIGVLSDCLEGIL